MKKYFLLNQQPVDLTDIPTDMTVLELVRERLHMTGTKEGCASGDCGACTVVVGELAHSQLRYYTVNSCITFAHQLTGKQLLTVEHLRTADGQLHPVQQVMVDHHGSQCGFCTPGFVMSLFSWYHSTEAPTRHHIEQALAGNLCRCTGYQPIIEAALYAGQHRQPDQFDQQQTATIAQLQQWAQAPSLASPATATDAQETAEIGYWQPTDRQQLAQLRHRHPQAKLVAGSTDLALSKTQQLQTLPALIDSTHVAELQQITEQDGMLHIGAAVPFSTLMPTLLAHWPALTELFERLGSQPIRNKGTLGGNLGNASPIGDCAPWIAALDGNIVTHNGQTAQYYKVSEFFTGYRQTQLAADEWIDHVEVPLPKPGQQLAAYKVSKRFDDDISTVCLAIMTHIDEQQRLTCCRLGAGGVAATPVALDLSATMQGLDWAAATTLQYLLDSVKDKFKPIDDVRASGQYRTMLITNLLRRYWYEHAQQQLTRVTDYA